MPTTFRISALIGNFKPTTNISPHISDFLSWLCLMSESPDTTECLVCLQATPKTRVHYGGVSCYSCRAFFRRNTRSGKTKKCKIDQDYTVSYMEHKHCTTCRYQRCLRSELNSKVCIGKAFFIPEISWQKVNDIYCKNIVHKSFATIYLKNKLLLCDWLMRFLRGAILLGQK